MLTMKSVNHVNPLLVAHGSSNDIRFRVNKELTAK